MHFSGDYCIEAADQADDVLRFWRRYKTKELKPILRHHGVRPECAVFYDDRYAAACTSVVAVLLNCEMRCYS